MLKRIILLICLISTVIFGQMILPASMDVMRELRNSYQNGEIDEYIRLVTRGQQLTEDDYDEISSEIESFFDSDQFLETGGAYLSALFTERELDEVLMVLNDSSLRSDPNFSGAQKLELMMKKLKPYIVKYLRYRSE